jgi:D-3-phosphoglycerate dehydrogenase
MEKHKKIKPTQIVFDFDSTILRGEMLEIIAEIALKNRSDKEKIIDKIIRITNLGMSGEIPFEESLSRRLEMIEISGKILKKTAEKIVGLIDEDYQKILPKLKKYELYLVSGGYKNLIDPLSEIIGISKERIFANSLIIKKDRFIGIDKTNPLAFSKGKIETVKNIKRIDSEILVIGDGATDLAIKKSGVADFFIAYTGTVFRSAVVSEADFEINSFLELEKIIELY